jgi:hypothetical protein
MVPAAAIKVAEARMPWVVLLGSLGPERSRYTHVIAQAFPLLAKEAELLAHHRCDLLERLLRGACTLPLEVDLALKQYSQRLLLARVVQELFDGSFAAHLECVGINLCQECPILKMEVGFDFRVPVSQLFNRSNRSKSNRSSSWRLFWPTPADCSRLAVSASIYCSGYIERYSCEKLLSWQVMENQAIAASSRPPAWRCAGT